MINEANEHYFKVEIRFGRVFVEPTFQKSI